MILRAVMSIARPAGECAEAAGLDDPWKPSPIDPPDAEISVRFPTPPSFARNSPGRARMECDPTQAARRLPAVRILRRGCLP